MESNVFHWNDIPTVTSLDAFEDAVEAFKRGGSRLAYREAFLSRNARKRYPLFGGLSWPHHDGARALNYPANLRAT